jgi:hypothetical protein
MTASELGKGRIMPDNTESNQTVDNATQGAPAETERTFTQAEMEAIIGERLKRERSKYADYNEIKAKAAKFDEAEEASKSELQKVVEERDKLKAELDKLMAEAARAEQVAKVAAEQGVDAALLSRMSGDVEENAAFLKAQMENKPKYEAVHDGGEVGAPAAKTEIPILI